MYNLILKDILIQKKILLLGFAYIVFFAVAMQGVGMVIYPTALTAITYMLLLTSCAYDEKNKADVMLNSLPLKRADIVLAKYLSVIAYIVIGTVAYWLIATVIALTGLPVKVHPISLEGLAGGLLSIALLNGVFLPLYFKFGYIKIKFLNLILFFLLFFGLTGAVNFLYVNGDVGWVRSITGLLNSLTDIQIFTAIMVVILITQLLSFLLSLKVYQSRDL
ncbi:ABC-2 transporter permease [Desulfoscipio sp. XC116]|uniref:ABC-2 transporter permease n=1 Tax=Desulfoscipio sp. XC116 TaxID=3144975 RepID=UPI00325B11A7